VKILFLIGASSRIRHFDRTILLLAERGHEIVLAGKPRKGEMRQPPAMRRSGISVVANPVTRSDAWRDVVEPVRASRDYVRYLAPRFGRAERLARRAQEFGPAGFVNFLDKHPGIRRDWRFLERTLALAEDLIPSDRGFEHFIAAHKPDAILVTPLVTFDSYQTDYVKAAHRLGIPIGFLPFSWDNLSNKGLMRVQPDRVIVWNDTQATEAVELHGTRPSRVVITGAPRFDEFFEMRPSMDRQSFCKGAQLDPRRPYVLYLCSSALGGPNEVDFVRLWVRELRKATDRDVRACGVLVRPHPANKEQWLNADLSKLPNVTVSRAGERNADQNLYDSLEYASGVVGLNTSAMLEAAILGKRVHTILAPGFDEGQVGTLHFNYLLESNGGLLIVAHDFAEHARQLAESLRLAKSPSPRSLAFIEGFLRPHGLDKPVAPLLADEVERLGRVKKAPVRRAVWQSGLSWLLLRYLRYILRVSDSGAALGNQQSLRPIHVALEALQHDTRPIAIGPWLDDFGLEALFWIPFVRWAVEQYQLDPQRIVAVSRHERARILYTELGGTFVHTHELCPDGNLERDLSQAVPQSEQNPKQLAVGPLDEELLRRALERPGAAGAHNLHPLLMFRLMRRFVADRTPERMRDVTRQPAVSLSDLPLNAPDLPDEYVAVSFPASAAFPDTEANRALARQIVGDIAQRSPVVVLDSIATGGARNEVTSAHPILGLALPTDDLMAHLAVVGRAKAYVGGLSDLAYVAPLLGTSAVAYYSKAVPRHLVQLAQQLFKQSVEFGALEAFEVTEYQAQQVMFLDEILSEKAAAPHAAAHVR
jgi:hypothetical protein